MPTAFYPFLCSLPALHAAPVFVLFHLLRGRSSGRVTARIMDKLRQDALERALKAVATIVVAVVSSRESSMAEVMATPMTDQRRVALTSMPRWRSSQRAPSRKNVKLSAYAPYGGKSAAVDCCKTIDWKRYRVVYFGPIASRLRDLRRLARAYGVFDGVAS